MIMLQTTETRAIHVSAAQDAVHAIIVRRHVLQNLRHAQTQAFQLEQPQLGSLVHRHML